MDSNTHNPSLNEETKERCDRLADQLLTKIKRRRVLTTYGVVEYVEEDTGDILMICADGSLLYTPAELGRQMGIKALKNGFRSDIVAIKQLCTAKNGD